jgi:CubicO group peptidase (beta-lactamase class C family)
MGIRTKLILNVLFFISTHCNAQHSSVHYSLEHLILNENKLGNFSGSVIVAEKQKIILSTSVGFGDRENNILIDSTTKFNIASVGKLFTQIVILQLIQEKRISLDDGIGKFFSGFNNPDADKITVSDLINHRSGLGDVYVSKEYQQNGNYSSPEKVVAIIAKEKLDFIPGTKMQYSNSGYYLLGAIASKIEAKSLAQIMNDRIFIPLRMTNSGFSKTGDSVEGHAIAYERKGSKAKRVNPGLIGDIPSGAGSQYSSSADLFKLFASIISDNTLLRDSSKALLFNHYVPASWEEIKKSGKIFGFVGGDTRGWSAKLTFMFINSTVYGVVIVANFDNMAHELDLKLRGIIKNIPN